MASALVALGARLQPAVSSCGRWGLWFSVCVRGCGPGLMGPLRLLAESPRKQVTGSHEGPRTGSVAEAPHA